jgi:hypothetical protein
VVGAQDAQLALDPVDLAVEVVLSGVLCEVGVTDAALGPGKATLVQPEIQN